MRNRRSGIVAVLLAFWAMLALVDSVRADQAQQQNPLFAQAQALAAQVASSSASAEVKANFSQRFTVLTAEQQDLWRLAGEVDAGHNVRAIVQTTTTAGSVRISV